MFIALFAAAVLPETSSSMLQGYIFDIVKVVFITAATAIGTGWIAAALTQALKWRLIAYPATRYPTVTAWILSFILAVPAVILTGLVTATGWISWLIIALASVFVATQSYDLVRAAIDEIRQRKV